MSHDMLAADSGDISLIRDRTTLAPRVALVLGSGLGTLADRIDVDARISFSELPGYPAPAAQVAGHAGELVLGTLAEQPVVAFLGRVHRYQGLSALDATWPVRLASGLGAEILVVTNAAGSVDHAIPAGAVMLIVDQMNLTGDNPLVGWPGPAGGTPFVPMGDAYDPDLRALAESCAEEVGVDLVTGVYAGLLGPTYETPAEVNYLHLIGANAVGMSTVPEVIVARALGMRVLGFSLITNAAGGGHLSHDEVLEAGKLGGAKLARLISAVLARMP